MPGFTISKGKLVVERFYTNGEVIPSIVEKPVKSLRSLFNFIEQLDSFQSLDKILMSI